MLRSVPAQLVYSLAIAFATIVPAHAVGNVWDAYFVVNVTDEPVVTKGGEIVRIEEPDFHTKL